MTSGHCFVLAFAFSFHFYFSCLIVGLSFRVVLCEVTLSIIRFPSPPLSVSTVSPLNMQNTNEQAVKFKAPADFLSVRPAQANKQRAEAEGERKNKRSTVSFGAAKGVSKAEQRKVGVSKKRKGEEKRRGTAEYGRAAAANDQAAKVQVEAEQATAAAPSVIVSQPPAESTVATPTRKTDPSGLRREPFVSSAVTREEPLGEQGMAHLLAAAREKIFLKSQIKVSTKWDGREDIRRTRNMLNSTEKEKESQYAKKLSSVSEAQPGQQANTSSVVTEASGRRTKEGKTGRDSSTTQQSPSVQLPKQPMEAPKRSAPPHPSLSGSGELPSSSSSRRDGKAETLMEKLQRRRFAMEEASKAEERDSQCGRPHQQRDRATAMPQPSSSASAGDRAEPKAVPAAGSASSSSSETKKAGLATGSSPRSQPREEGRFNEAQLERMMQRRREERQAEVRAPVSVK